jgi:4-hydroxy-3-methylbut-2-enyl diphosphate reductase
MKVIKAEKLGWCFGVERAVDMAFAEGAKKGGPVATLGPIIHNPQMVEKLQAKGVGVVEEVAELPQGARMVVSAYGAPRQDYEEAEARGIQVVDTTCPYVTRGHKIVEQLLHDGYGIVIVGDKGHQEVEGLLGFCGGKGQVISTPEEARAIRRLGKVGVVVQTTQRIENFKAVVNVLMEKAREIRIFNTICQPTLDWQEACHRLAGTVDAMVIVGGKGSANTKRLHQIALEHNPRSHHVETAKELEMKWFSGCSTVGLTAGASTPDWLINEVVEVLEKAKT